MEVSINEQTPSIKLIRGQKNSYGFEIKVFGKDMDKVLEELKQVNDKLVEQYCEGGGEDEE
jgi:hypothetical protein